jgi:hypothetical protein
MTLAANFGKQSMIDTIDLLEKLLTDARMSARDPEALNHVLHELTDLVNLSLSSFVPSEIGSDEKARLVQLSESIVELEQALRNRQGVLTAFSVHFREMVNV